MLTPRSDDPNREAQLKERQAKPDRFGAVHEKNIDDKKKATEKTKK